MSAKLNLKAGSFGQVAPVYRYVLVAPMTQNTSLTLAGDALTQLSHSLGRDSRAVAPKQRIILSFQSSSADQVTRERILHHVDDFGNQCSQS